MLFFNLSNHPFVGWADDQKNAAQKFGGNNKGNNTIVDVAFPNVPPTADRLQVERMAQDTYSDLCERVANYERMGGKVDTASGGAAVMLAGEMSFCIAFADVVKKNNRGFRLFTILAACTERISKDLGDGKKEQQFIFRQFRPLF
jgi:hypothetical protein